MKVISNKDDDLLSQFDYFNENDKPILERLFVLTPQIRSTPHQKILIRNHFDANKGRNKRYLYSEDIFGFCKIFENLGFHVTLKTNDLQEIIYTSMADDIKINY